MRADVGHLRLVGGVGAVRPDPDIRELGFLVLFLHVSVALGSEAPDRFSPPRMSDTIIITAVARGVWTDVRFMTGLGTLKRRTLVFGGGGRYTISDSSIRPTLQPVGGAKNC